MSDVKHARLEQLKELLNFSDGGAFLQYSNGYTQAEEDCRVRMENALTNLDQKLGMKHSQELLQAMAASELALADDAVIHNNLRAEVELQKAARLAAEERVRELAALAEHRTTCGVWKNYTKMNAGKCTCGLSNALAEKEKS